MENIDILLIILGILLALIVAGWTIMSHRKEKSRVFSNSFSASPQQNTSFGHENPPSVAPAEPSFSPSAIEGTPPVYASYSAENSLQPEELQQDVENRLSGIRVKLPNQPESVSYSQPIPEQSVPMSAVQSEVEQVSQPHVEPQVETVEEQASPSYRQIQLFVMAGEGQVFAGRDIVHQLENLGFVYGEYNIYHRHIDGTSDSPVIYSAANVLNPGAFDLSQIDQLSTIGIIFFMYLPSVGNDLVNFNKLVSDARELAQALGGWLVDDQQRLFDEDSHYRYLAQLRQAH